MNNTAKIDLDIIWDITTVCGWDCSFCCVDAVQVEQHGDGAILRKNNLQDEVEISVGSEQTAYEAGSEHLKKEGIELTLNEKMGVLESMSGFTPDIDFSGGDPLLVPENYEVVKEASERFPDGEVAVTATGAGLPHYDVAKLGSHIDQLEFTYDSHTIEYDHRPDGYNTSNLAKAEEFSKAGVVTKAQTPLSKENMTDENIEKIYRNLTEAGVDKVLLMRLFPVGRGADANMDVLDQDEYRRAIERYKQLEDEMDGPEVKLQCALKHLYPDQNTEENPCDLIHESFGIMADGTVIASAWASHLLERPPEEFVLGEVPEESFTEIYEKEKTQRYLQRLDENWGHCKIFSYLHNGMDEDALFDSDPLYTSEVAE